MEVDSSDDERSVNGQSIESDDEIMTQTKHLIAGKIVTIHIKNFLTHTEATVHPSEQLNLVSLCKHIFIFDIFVNTTNRYERRVNNDSSY